MKPSHQQSHRQEYQREPAPAEEITFAQELVKQDRWNPDQQTYLSLKHVKNAVRSYLQEKKALYKVYATGDWVLRTRQRSNKQEPFYDGPWAIIACHDGNTYSLASPGGIRLNNRYNGSQLYPAYVQDGHPVRSLWYASKRYLEADRARIADSVNLH